MKVRIITEDVEEDYHVYWKHVNQVAIKGPSFTQCFIEIRSFIDEETHSVSEAFMITGTVRLKAGESFNRKIGIKESFKKAVKDIEDMIVRKILWELFWQTFKPSYPVYFYKGKPYKIVEHTKLRASIGWMEAIIYRPLYKGADSKTYVRSEYDFFRKFKTQLELDGQEENISNDNSRQPEPNHEQQVDNSSSNISEDSVSGIEHTQTVQQELSQQQSNTLLEDVEVSNG